MLIRKIVRQMLSNIVCLETDMSLNHDAVQTRTCMKQNKVFIVINMTDIDNVRYSVRLNVAETCIIARHLLCAKNILNLCGISV